MLRRSRRFTRDFKLQVLREIEAGMKAAEVCRKYELHPRLIGKWRQQLYEAGERNFLRGPFPAAESSTVAELERKIGQQTMEIAFLKKVLQRLETRLRSTPKPGTKC